MQESVYGSISLLQSELPQHVSMLFNYPSLCVYVKGTSLHGHVFLHRSYYSLF